MFDRALELDSHFHEVGALFSGDDIPVEKLVPHDTVGAALSIMHLKNYSQMPVLEDEHVLGVFSLRSLAKNLPQTKNQKIDPLDLYVEDLLEKIPFVTVKDSMYEILKYLDEYEAVLVGREN
jgi:predicted transcriptional regulator